MTCDICGKERRVHCTESALWVCKECREIDETIRYDLEKENSRKELQGEY
jgi:ribosome-binding protein aMBF1 (putative translation factor)